MPRFFHAASHPASHPARPPALHRACLLAFFLCVVLPLSASLAQADHAMPSVIGKTEAEAVRQLESIGLEVQIVTVAEAPPGRVSEQQPPEGARVEAGDEVSLRVGVRLKIRTFAPRVIGRSEQLVLATLGLAYDLEVAYVTGPRSMEGRVIRQRPNAGESVFLRARFVVEVVRNSVIVPMVVGRAEQVALRLLEEAGLSAHVRYLSRGAGSAPRVLSQDPRSGAEILPGGVVELRVSGRRPERPRPVRVLVPDLLGLDLAEAEAALLARGLIPHVHLDSAPGHRPFEVLSQEVGAHTRVAEGAPVGLRVSKPPATAGGILMPSLYGLGRTHALELLHHLGLKAQVREQPSALPEGTVYRQDFATGSRMQPGRVVTINVAVRPPRGWIVPLVLVPDLNGLTPAGAHIKLIGLGLLPRFGRETAPDWRVDRVFGQTPQAGRRIRAGSRVVYKLPFRAKVPDLLGKTRTQALDDLQMAGLEGLGSMRGPDLPGLTEVVWQEVRSGGVIARGSLVKFHFRKTPVASAMRSVPNVIGKTVAQAESLLRAAGFRPRMRAAAFGSGETLVIRQSPRGGEMRPRGHEVVATWRYVIGSGRDQVRVPRLIGMSGDEAAAQLRMLGLGIRLVLQGTQSLGTSEVVAQNPAAGMEWPRGGTIVVTYVMRALPGQSLVLVPSVVGKRLDKALKAVKSAGLRPSFSHLGTHVKSQEPAAGTRVASGSTVKLKLGF